MPRPPAPRRRAPAASARRRPQVEPLEPRLLMAALEDAEGWLLDGHGAVCGCPICRGLVEASPAMESFAGATSAAHPLSSLPILHSRAEAAIKLHLDFDGHVQSQWGSWSNVTTRVYDRDGDATTFSDSELASIQEIWARVAEDYAPFNVDVTTQDPGSLANGVVVKIAIGGNWSDWFGQSAGGVAYVGAFTNSAPNVGYVFEDALGNGNARYVAEAASHEAGHTFGLLHQSTWSGGTLTAEYNQGNAAWAPIMGVGYYSQRTTWHNGSTSQSPTSTQDDFALLAAALGQRGDDHGNTIPYAGALPVSGGVVNVSGVVEHNRDVDMWSFTTSGGAAQFDLSVASFGANLDAILELRDAQNNLLVMANPSDSLGGQIQTTLAAGTYYLVARGNGVYGNVGQFTITGQVNVAAAAPEIEVWTDAGALADGGSLAFGSTSVGAAVNRTIYVRNTGGGVLALSPLHANALPAGFALVSNLGSTSLAAGATTSFVVQLTAAAAGNFGGGIALTSNDADEAAYDIQLSGSVTAPVPAVRILDNGEPRFYQSGPWQSVTTTGRDRDQLVASRGPNTAQATWVFADLQPGTYQIAATWSGTSGNATNSPFWIVDGDELIANVRIAQNRLPLGLTADGSRWKSLGTFEITSTTAVVHLTNDATGKVVADAIRIQRVGDLSGSAALAPVFAATTGEPAGAALAAAETALPTSGTATSERPSAESSAGTSAAAPAVGSEFDPVEIAILETLQELDGLARSARSGAAAGAAGADDVEPDSPFALSLAEWLAQAEA